jgi:NusA N-terminal domain.
MVSKQFFEALKYLAIEREIPEDRLLDIFRKGLESAYKKQYDKAENVTVEFQPDKNRIVLFANKTVVKKLPEDAIAAEYILLKDAKELKKNVKDGEVLQIEITPKDFGRLAASQTKQILNQGLRDYEKELAFNFFKEKKTKSLLAQSSR